MTADALGYILAVLTIGMSMVAVRYRNMLLTLGSATLWATLMAFILANTVAGTNWQTMFILGAVAFMCAFALIGLFSRRGAEKGETMTGGVEYRETGMVTKPPERTTPSLMGMSADEYKVYIRGRVRRRRR